MVLVSMLRIEKNLHTFLFEQLRAHMHKSSMLGIGYNVLSNRMIQGNWRPKLPRTVYPQLRRLIKRCWQTSPEDRPNFDEIVHALSGPISVEVTLMPEPMFADDAPSGDWEQRHKEGESTHACSSGGHG